MRRFAVFFAVSLAVPTAALADAQFTADDIINHFKKNQVTARSAPAPSGGAEGARPVLRGDDAPIALPLTGAKRSVTIGTSRSKAIAGTGLKIGKAARVGTTIGKPAGTTIGQGNLNLLITFESGSDRLTAQAMRNLDAFASALNSPSLATFVFEVQGHTDARGAAEVNQRLSQRRAESVVSYLVGHGVDGGRLQARGYGETQPLMSDPNHPRNRRVETRLLR